ncbi:MAG: UPF0104 family protein [Deltaproteobacteria bacterium]|nr:MAG: UPF0104 family protein [Deltaproteobacteria bacterium]
MNRSEEMDHVADKDDVLNHGSVRPRGADSGGVGGDEVPCRKKAPASTAKKIILFVLRLTIGVAIILWIFKSVDPGIFKTVAVSPRLIPMVAMVVCSLLFVFLGGFKLWILLRVFSPINLWMFTGYFFLAGSIGSLAPAILGDFTLIGLAKRSKIPVHESVSALLMDRFVTMVIALFVFTPFTLMLFLPLHPLYMLLFSVISLLLAGGLAWLFLLAAPILFDKLAITKRFWESFSLYMTRYRVSLFQNILISGVRGIVSGLTLIFALMAAKLSPPLIATICISNSLSILTHIPVSLSGLGLFEGSGLVLFVEIGLNKEQVLAGLFYHRAYIILWAVMTSCLLTLVFVIRRKLKK